MTVIYRRAEFEDIPGAARVYAGAVNDLNERHGFGDQLVDPGSPNPFYAFAVQEEPDGFWVAEADGEIAGMTISWLRGSFWFLACLFISPANQGQGIGQNLLDRALGHGSRGEVTNRALITFAYNRVSTSLYMRYGMYPRELLYRMNGIIGAGGLAHGDAQPFDSEQLRAVPDSLSQLYRFDELALGFSLGKHHEYLLNAEGATCYLFRKAGSPEGYAYIWSNGHVGPLAASSPNSFEGVMNSALGLAAMQDAPEVSVLIPGSNERAVAIALERGLQIALPLLLMSSKPFGNWAAYLFHSPALM